MRAYTPSSSDDQLGYFELVVKIYRANEHPRFPDGGAWRVAWVEQQHWWWWVGVWVGGGRCREGETRWRPFERPLAPSQPCCADPVSLVPLPLSVFLLQAR